MMFNYLRALKYGDQARYYIKNYRSHLLANLKLKYQITIQASSNKQNEKTEK